MAWRFSVPIRRNVGGFEHRGRVVADDLVGSYLSPPCPLGVLVARKRSPKVKVRHGRPADITFVKNRRIH